MNVRRENQPFLFLFFLGESGLSLCALGGTLREKAGLGMVMSFVSACLRIGWRGDVKVVRANACSF